MTREEQKAIIGVLALGHRFGFGNLVSHLQTEWARVLMEVHGLDEELARHSAGGPGYPLDWQKEMLSRPL